MFTKKKTTLFKKFWLEKCYLVTTRLWLETKDPHYFKLASGYLKELVEYSWWWEKSELFG